MFTGLIEATGRVREVKPTPVGFRLRVETPLAGELSPGDSLAVNGVCLTIILSTEGELHADVSPETARVTTLGALELDAVVNLERPLRADGRLGGHFVQGHVDTTGTVEAVRPEAECHWLTIAYPSLLGQYMVRKGSIAVDGVSLTIAGLGPRRFDVQIVPFTWEHTNLSTLHARQAVNLECDILGKYVARSVELGGVAPSGGAGPH